MFITVNRPVVWEDVNKQIYLTGECWSGPDSHLTYYRDGISGTRCVNQCFDPCTKTSPFCSGTGFANYVYRISKEDNLRKPDIRVNFKSRKSFFVILVTIVLVLEVDSHFFPNFIADS